MLADLTNLPVAVAPHPETTLLGAGLIGWVGLGRWPDPATAAAALPPSSMTVDPDPGRVVDYRTLLDRYQSALDGLRLSGLLTLSREENRGDRSQSQG